MPDHDLTARIALVVKNAPEWVRTDLASRDPAIRERGEETIAAMIVSAIDAEAVLD